MGTGRSDSSQPQNLRVFKLFAIRLMLEGRKRKRKKKKEKERKKETLNPPWPGISEKANKQEAIYNAYPWDWVFKVESFHTAQRTTISQSQAFGLMIL